MNRQSYFDFIERKLSELATRIELLGGLNLLNLHLHSENFYRYFINLLFGWDLKNLNAVQANAPGIDLIDKTNKIIAQVSSTATRQKIEAALAKNLSMYKGYYFKFISISKDAGDLRTKTFLNPHKLAFSPAADIHDIRSLLTFINSMETDKMAGVYDFLKKELKSEPDPEKTETNLARIIGVLSQEDWNQKRLSFETIPFQIPEKISENKLVAAIDHIEDYKIYYPRIDKIYSDFDKQGKNKSLSILNGIRAEYVALFGTGTPDQIFFAIIDKVAETIRKSSNYYPIPDEELMLSVRILVVDAFIRCKIFKNPLKKTNAHS